jgi:hypothetical protein
MPTNVIMPALELAQIHMLRRNEFAPLRTGMGHCGSSGGAKMSRAPCAVQVPGISRR